MILVMGAMTDSVIGHVVHRLTERGEEFVLLDPREFGRSYLLDWGWRGGRFEAVLERGGERRLLDEGTGVYVHQLGGFSGSASQWDEADVRWALGAFAEAAPYRVANRPSASATNYTKPWQQMTLTEAGFATPRTLVTNDPEAAREFYAACRKKVIFKSVSARRSIVRRMTDADLERLELLESGPVQFQQWVVGTDVRVHVTGEQVFATEITTEAMDYRYSGQEEKPRQMRGVTLPGEIAGRCVELTRRLGLLVAGVDLRRGLDGQYYCFEANPRPAFTFFEQYTGQRIADGLIDVLVG